MNHEPDMKAIKAAAKREFSSITGVQGFGIGDRFLNIYVSSEQIRSQLPTEFMGVSVNVVVTGEISTDC
jgi:hypothetical protein